MLTKGYLFGQKIGKNMLTYFKGPLAKSDFFKNLIQMLQYLYPCHNSLIHVTFDFKNLDLNGDNSKKDVI